MLRQSFVERHGSAHHKGQSLEGQKRIAAETGELTAFSIELEACLKKEVATKAASLNRSLHQTGMTGSPSFIKPDN